MKKMFLSEINANQFNSIMTSQKTAKRIKSKRQKKKKKNKKKGKKRQKTLVYAIEGIAECENGEQQCNAWKMQCSFNDN